MEFNDQAAISQIQSLQQAPQSIQKSNNKVKLLIFILLSLIITTGLVFTRIQTDKYQMTENKQLITPSPYPLSQAEEVIQAEIDMRLVSDFTPIDHRRRSGSYNDYILFDRSNHKQAFYFDSNNNRVGLININNSFGNASYCIGSDKPIYSPQLGLLLYVNSDNNIWIRDMKKSINYQISTEGSNESKKYWGTKILMTDWSNDGQYVVYHVEHEYCQMGPCPELEENPNIKSGFYIADIFGGKIYYSTSISCPKRFLPNSHKLLSSNDQYYNFDNNTVVNTPIYTSQIISHQFSISKNNKFIVYSPNESYNSSGSEGYSKIIIHSLTDNKQNILANGKFAQYQRPQLSSDSKWLNYKNEKTTVVYSFENGTSNNLEQAYEEYWTQDDRLIRLIGEGNDNISFTLYEPLTYRVTTILKFDEQTQKALEGVIEYL